MTTSLRARLFRLGGRAPADPDGFSWRQVPRISLIPKGRASLINPLVLGLMAVILIQVFVLQDLYRGKVSTDDTAAVLTTDLDSNLQAVSTEESAIAEENAKIKAIVNEINQLGSQRDLVVQVREELASTWIDWGGGGAVEALLAADGLDIRLDEAVTEPGEKMKVTATAADVAAIGRFQDHLKSVGDTLVLQSLQWEQIDSSVVINAIVEVR